MSTPIPQARAAGPDQRAPQPASRNPWLLLEAVACLGLARLALALLPFRAWAQRLGARGASTPAAACAEHEPAIAGITWAVAAAAARLPGETSCLARALAARGMLRRRSVPSTLYLGVGMARPNEEPLKAHAWLRAGTRVVTGRAEAALYGELTRFA